MPNSFVIDDGEADVSDYLVCVLATEKTEFSDNVFDVCCECGVKVQHRPHAPARAQRICLRCMMPQIEAAAAEDKLDVRLSPQTIAEVAAYLRRRRAS